MKIINVSDEVYSYLEQRGGYKRPMNDVIWELIRIVKRCEADRAKYQRWIEASEVKESEEEKKGGLA